MSAEVETVPFYTVKSLAERLSMSDRAVRDLIRADGGRRPQIPSYKVGGSRRIDPVDVEAYLRSRRDGE